MTKKKMRKMIIKGMLLFFIAASLLNLFVSWSMLEEKFRDCVRDYIGFEYVKNLSEDFESKSVEIYEETPEKFGELFMHYYSSKLTFGAYPYSLAIADREGTLTFASDNFIYIRDLDFGHMYVDIDDYLTDELKKEIRKFLKSEENFHMQYIDELSLYCNGEEYIPIKMKCRLFKDAETKEFTFTDYEPTLILNIENTIQILPCFNEINAPLYYRHYYDKLKEDIKAHYERNKDNMNFVYGAGYSMGGGDAHGSMGAEIGDGYEIFFAFAYNIPIDTFLSYDFQYMTIYLAIFFAVAGIIFYIMCMKVINKSQKLDEAKSTFISAASHELKTPLAVIQNQCECIMENVAPEKNEEYVSSIYDEALRMNSIVSSLLSYNRLSQLTEIEKENCNLSELLREEVKFYRNFAENNGVTIEENISADVYISCNVQLMKMAIDNYLSNAIKYAVGDKVVKVNLSTYKSVFTLEVINPADKISVDIAKDVWNEFSRGDSARQRQGASVGMGLPICKKIFELHGFNYYCQYKQGKAYFTVLG